MTTKTITVEELQENIEEYIDLYDKGDDTHYLVKHEGKEFMVIPFDGPWKETVQEDDEGEAFVEIPNRLLSKMGWVEGEEVNMEVKDGQIFLTKKEEDV